MTDALALTLAAPAAAQDGRARESIAAAEAKLNAAEKVGAGVETPRAAAEARAVLNTAKEALARGEEKAAIDGAIRAQAMADAALGVTQQNKNEAIAATAAEAEANRATATQATVEAQAARAQAAEATARADSAQQSAAMSAADAAAVEVSPLTQDSLRALAAQHVVCPYYLGQEMVRWADVVVGDYNYFFDGSAILSALQMLNEWQVTVLVDGSLVADSTATGVKDLLRSQGRVLNSGSSDTESDATRKVWWSLGARSTASTPFRRRAWRTPICGALSTM